MPPFMYAPRQITKRRLHPMVRQHEVILDVLRNPALSDTLQQLIADAGARKQWAKNAFSSARAAGFDFPQGTEVSFKEFASGWEVEVRIYEEPYTYIFGFNSVKGFYYK